jgi:hypothetical protein
MRPRYNLFAGLFYPRDILAQRGLIAPQDTPLTRQIHAYIHDAMAA